jgi:hypothetical protein
MVSRLRVRDSMGPGDAGVTPKELVFSSACRFKCARFFAAGVISDNATFPLFSADPA